MANEWNEVDISFDDSFAEKTSAIHELSLGETVEVIPTIRTEPINEPTNQEKHKAEVNEKRPPWVESEDSDATLNWAIKREENLQNLRGNKAYQFIMLVCSYTDQPIERYWTNISTNSHEHIAGAMSGVNTVGNLQGGVCTSVAGAGKSEDPIKKAVRTFEWYIDSPWVTGILYLTPAVYGHIEEAYIAITNLNPRLQNCTLGMFTESRRTRSMFAKVVAMCIRKSNVLAQKRYSLDGTYRRINIELRKLMFFFKNVHWNGTELVYGLNRVGEQPVPDMSKFTFTDMQDLILPSDAKLRTMLGLADGF
jgi:hypothetical protein